VIAAIRAKRPKFYAYEINSNYFSLLWMDPSLSNASLLAYRVITVWIYS